MSGVEIDDCIMIEDDDILFLSSGDDFIAPSIDNGLSYRITHGLDREKLPSVVNGYKVGKLLGRGGFGEVRVGEHQLTGEKVALKFLRKADILSIGAAERTVTEIQCLSALKHQNIIRLQQVQWDYIISLYMRLLPFQYSIQVFPFASKQHYFSSFFVLFVCVCFQCFLLQHMESPQHVVLVFELMEGGDLKGYLHAKGSDSRDAVLSEDESRQVFHQIVSGVSFAHNQHICHRDLKLENVL